MRVAPRTVQRPPSLKGWGFFVVRLMTARENDDGPMHRSPLVRRCARRGALTPSLDRVRCLASGSTRSGRANVPIFREIMADAETPVSAFLKITAAAPDSSSKASRAESGSPAIRSSAPIRCPESRWKMASRHLEPTAIRERHTPIRSPCWKPMLAPYRSRDDRRVALARDLWAARSAISPTKRSARSSLGSVRPAHGLGLPAGRFMLVDSLLVFDHRRAHDQGVSHLDLDGRRPSDEAYAVAAARVDDLVAKLRAPLPASMPVRHRAGCRRRPIDRSQSNTPRALPRRWSKPPRSTSRPATSSRSCSRSGSICRRPAHPFTIYRALRDGQPSPYMFYLDFGDHQIVGASPELLVRVEDGVVTNHPIAGTRPRGATPEDETSTGRRAAGRREGAGRAHHAGRSRPQRRRPRLQPGTVRVPELMEVERYSHVMHIVSNVEGEIARPGSTASTPCAPASRPARSPARRKSGRWRSSPSSRPTAAASMPARSATSTSPATWIPASPCARWSIKDGVASMQAGGGIVADSTPEGEYAECFHKMRALLRAIELAEASNRRIAAEASSHDPADR